MKIGFDAKRAFFNTSGLGNYSRNLIDSLESFYPRNQYLLYTPSGYPAALFSPGQSTTVITPKRWVEKKLPAFWRSFSLTKQLAHDLPDLYHGLSAELPYGINNIAVPSIVTVHDLIFIRHPELYNRIDRKIYLYKVRKACNQATRIIAISKQTRDDLIAFLGINPKKIDIVYQSCHPEFFNKINQEVRKQVQEKYLLPDNYLLYVGTIEERKNLLGLIKAMEIAKPGIPLVVVGKPRKYADMVKKYIRDHKPCDVFFLEKVLFTDFPGLYQMASLFIYPSVFEGFGIPIIEALASGVPVITSKGGCFAEAGGPASFYTDPQDPISIAKAITKILSSPSLRKEMITRGKEYVVRFSPQTVATNMMETYEKTITTA